MCSSFSKFAPLALAFSVLACNAQNAPQKIKPEQAKLMLADTSVALLDVREPDEFAEKHIVRAKLLPLGTIADNAEKLLPNKDQPLIVYCRSGGRSAQAAKLLVRMGYTRVYDAGGILNWPYETEP
jgi:rhodanese-related sulfurtransferase